MKAYPKYISIEKIAKMMNFRVERVLIKVEKMQLKLTKANKLNRLDAVQLVNSFLYSKKTSTKTKRNAEIMLKFLNNKDLSSEKSINVGCLNNNIEHIVIDNIKQKWYKKKIDSLSDFVKVLLEPFSKMVQLFFQKNIQFLESDHFKFMALMVAISVQMHHSAIWFQRVTPDANTSVYAAYGYAFMVDLFILVITMEGKISIAKTFATLTFLSNVLYFQFWVEFSCTPQAYTNAISSLLISGIMAYIIYAYTELFVKYR